MENNTIDTGYDRQFVRNMLESALRIGLVFILLVMTYDIISPFVVPLLWGGIIAIAVFPLVKLLEPRLGGRRGLASTIVTLFFIVLLVAPCFMVTESLLGSVKSISANLNDGGLQIPPPPASVAEIPLVGEKIHENWSLANSNLEAALGKGGVAAMIGHGGLCARILSTGNITVGDRLEIRPECENLELF